MVVRKAWLPGTGTYTVEATNDVYNPTVGTIRFSATHLDDDVGGDQEKQDDSQTTPTKAVVHPEEEGQEKPALQWYLNIASLANLATVEQSDARSANPGEWKAKGAPTEIAVEVFASRFGWNRINLSQNPTAPWKQMAEFPFDSDVKKMSVIFQHVASGAMHIFTKVSIASSTPCSSVAPMLTKVTCK